MRLELHEIVVAAGSFRLGPLSLSAGDGEYLFVLGPTGAGKTLTLQAIAGLRQPMAGRVIMDGRDVTRSAPEMRRVGYLFQDSLLFPHLSVRKNLAYGAHRIPPREREATIARLARVVGIEPLLGRMPAGLSGGERQRVALARALATSPGLLLLDEPMASLDPNSRQALRATLLELHRELGTTTIHVTHSFSEALTLADRVAILIEGKILQIGPARDVFARPASQVIAGFLRSATRAAEREPPDPENGAPTLIPLDLKLVASPNGSAWAAPELHAESATLAIGPQTDGAAELVAGRIVAIDKDGNSLRIGLNIGVRLSARLPVSETDAGWLVEGASVWVRIPKGA